MFAWLVLFKNLSSEKDIFGVNKYIKIKLKINKVFELN